jgi:hypothetical protein
VVRGNGEEQALTFGKRVLMDTYVLQIVGHADGSPTDAADLYVVEYDPDGVLELTRERDKARRFLRAGDAFDCWRAVASPPEHVRPDGQPNRPLTAFTVKVQRVDAT